MTPRSGVCRGLLLAAMIAAAGAEAGSAQAGGADAADTACAAASLGIGAPLEHTRQLIDSGKSPLILAIGSSSTLGTGASRPGMSYPDRLERDLAQAFPERAIRVLNDGRGGQDAEQELARLDRDLGTGQPDLVIWQVGTNALLRGYDLEAERRLIERGIDEIKEHKLDAVLMDLQYAPKVLARTAWPDMERLIADTAKRERIGYFRRFEIMREWSQSGRWPAGTLIGPDGLHMTDASYGCLAAGLAQSLGRAWRQPDQIAHARQGPATAGELPAFAIFP